ncbi:MAG TPA: DUF1616 domain-containing protein [Candidatus Lokiarchaeia archaeon]|nr:DUF1616 domain-containing protein [Candidatus Lokiarchaeia archaeon]
MESRANIENWLRTILIISILVVTGFIVYVTIFNQNKPYINFGLLNQGGQMGNYPNQVEVGQEFSLGYFVDNHNPNIQDFSVRTYLANYTTSTVTFENGVEGGQLLNVYNLTINNGENYTSNPMQFALNSTGLNFRICFELWVYNQTVWNYLENSVQYIWLNCTT